MSDETEQLRHDQIFYPVRVNDPKMIVFWDLSEVRPIILAGVIGVIVGQMNLGLLIGFIGFWLVKKMNMRYSKGVVEHFFWWHGFNPVNRTPSMPDPFIREIYR